MNKYYTPEAEDFKIGLEFEFQTSDKEEWFKYIFGLFPLPPALDMEGWFEELSTLIAENRIRVKCLDKQDILSAGWIKKRPSDYGYRYHKLVFIDGIERELTIEFTKEKISIITDADLYEGEDYILQGAEIKNISELRFIQKRLGIK